MKQSQYEEAYWKTQRTHLTPVTLLYLFTKCHYKSILGTGVLSIHDGHQSIPSGFFWANDCWDHCGWVRPCDYLYATIVRKVGRNHWWSEALTVPVLYFPL